MAYHDISIASLTEADRIRSYRWILLLFWTLSVAASLLWSIQEDMHKTYTMALIQARGSFEKDVLFRRWNAMHGGVYVPITRQTPPNPYLNVPEQNLTTPSGRELTLVNPAYMTRQLHELQQQTFGVHGHITSLKPIRPENAPDPWERRALLAFEQGEEEVSSRESIDGQPYLRLMRPLLTEKPCMQCHEVQGYQVGDVRGGISVAIPMAPLLAASWNHRLSMIVSYGILWFIGLMVIALGGRRLLNTVAGRKQAEQALVQSNRNLEEAQQIARLGSWEWNIVSGTLRWSSEVFHIFGQQADRFQVSYQAFLDSVHPDDREQVRLAMEQALADPENHYGEVYRIVRPDGVQRIVEALGSVERDPHGQPLKMVGTVQDITEQKQTEAELELYRQRLEELVEQRTRELLLARDAADSANRAKSVFLGNISHELRTPLNVILGFTQLMQHDMQLRDKWQLELASMAQSGDRLLQLINHLLELPRMESGTLEQEQSDTDLCALLDDLQRRMAPTAECKGLELLVQPAPDAPCYVRVDHDKLHFVLHHLLENAIKYTDSGSVRLTLDHSEKGDMHRLSFMVKDTGRGITPAQQAHIFDTFYQSERGEQAGEGAGLGLAVCREYVRLMGGELALESSTEPGSRFHFTIPAKVLEESEIDARARIGRPTTLAPGQPDLRILVVEENPDERRLLRGLLEQTGFLVVDVVDSEQALSNLEWQPQLILISTQQAQTDRCQRLKDSCGETTPVLIALGGNLLKHERDALLAGGCDHIIPKPLNADDLLALIAQELGAHYLYQNTTAPTEHIPLASLLQELPRDVRQELHEAACSLDESGCYQIIERIEESHRDLANALRLRLNQYSFEEIQRLTEEPE